MLDTQAMMNQKSGVMELERVERERAQSAIRLTKREDTSEERRAFEDEVGEKVLEQKNVMGNTFQAFVREHYIFALFSENGRKAPELFKRMTYLLATLITVLFVCCLSAPTGGYLCPEAWEDLEGGGYCEYCPFDGPEWVE